MLYHKRQLYLRGHAVLYTRGTRLHVCAWNQVICTSFSCCTRKRAMCKYVRCAGVDTHPMRGSQRGPE